MNNQSKILKKENRDLWYKKMGEYSTVKIEDEPVVGLIEWVDLMVEY